MILDGKKLAEKILKEVKEEIEQKQLKLKLAVVLVGEDEISKIYVEKKKKVCQKVGIGFELFEFAQDIEQEQLEKEIERIAERKDVLAVVVQLPLPENIDTDKILNMIPQEKDVEGFVSNIDSPVVLAVEGLLKEYNISLEAKNIVVIGKGRLVGKPVAEWLLNRGLDFKVIDKSEKDISSITKKADIIITGTGVPNLIKEDMVKQGVVIIDIGTCKLDDKVVGDVDFENVCSRAKCITPCIGGVGPLNIAFLLSNILTKTK
ncbi:hypothetical protein AMJ47_00770 [Parcubacteria bacterium DG_72]|nr:MAG: hypothetical protein AMJ47_00770 [Parcubacteria bacterium DG_72]